MLLEIIIINFNFLCFKSQNSKWISQKLFQNFVYDEDQMNSFQESFLESKA